MIRIEGKHVVLGVTGSISAYKSATIASRLTQLGAEVDVIMTSNACKLISPATFEALTHRRVFTDTFDESFTGEVNHIAIARRADLVLIAPCTANMLAKLAHGIADDMLSSTMLAVTSPTWLAPAMNTFMYENAATQANLATLRERGFRIIEPTSGALACGSTGKGRMPDPEALIASVVNTLALPHVLHGKKVVVSAGATREFIDAVRFLSNPSTGKMGVACAQAAQMLGADVTLVAGHMDVPAPESCHVISVTSAADMAKTMFEAASDADIIIMSAAVSDFTPVQCADHKVHKTDAETNIVFVPTTDILKTLGQNKRPGQFLCGFCMETNDLLERAQQKLQNKNADLIVANSIRDPGCGFAHDTNGVTLITPDAVQSLPVMPKDEVAIKILTFICQKLGCNPQKAP